MGPQSASMKLDVKKPHLVLWHKMPHKRPLGNRWVDSDPLTIMTTGINCAEAGLQEPSLESSAGRQQPAHHHRNSSTTRRSIFAHSTRTKVSKHGLSAINRRSYSRHSRRSSLLLPCRLTLAN